MDTDGDSLYDINTECVWILVAPPTHIIELTFLYMDIEWHKNCEWDYIRVRYVTIMLYKYRIHS